MFLPGRSVEQERAERKQHFTRIEQWSMELLPSDAIRNACAVSVQEVQCGDPQCAPIDTLVSFIFDSGGQGMVGIPLEAKDVTLDDLKEYYPPPEIFDKWFQGEEADWPPAPEPQELRFDVGTAVLCRLGPTEWAPGHVLQQWYREPNWPEGAYAPYKIRLDIGRDIYAPQDIDQVIRLNPNGNPGQS